MALPVNGLILHANQFAVSKFVVRSKLGFVALVGRGLRKGHAPHKTGCLGEGSPNSTKIQILNTIY